MIGEFFFSVKAAAAIVGSSLLSIIQFPKTKKTGPCTEANVSSPENTVLILPQANYLCPAQKPQYDFAYFSPVNDPLKSSNLVFTSAAPKNEYFLPSSRGSIIQQSPATPLFSFTYGGEQQTEYVTMQARYTTVKENVNLYTTATSISTLGLTAPLNLCPQAFVLNATTASSAQFATAVPFPVKNDIESVPVLWVIPGLSSAATSANGINVPSLTSVPTGINYTSAEGLANTLYVIAKYATTIFIELGGAYGGDVPIYTSGIDPLTGLPRSAPGYIGGRPGIVFGLYQLKTNDVLKIFLGSKGDEILTTTGLTSFDGNGQGGLATVFGGANGGGASYIVHYSASNYSNNLNMTLTAAIDSKDGLLVCVAGGGGGASRNASGGAAGQVDTDFTYGQDNASVVNNRRIPVSSNGSYGGAQFITGISPFQPNINVNGLSGGGGTQSRGGVSTVPNQVPLSNSSWGHKLEPFVDTGINGHHGGGSVSTDKGSGGGGGGGGLFGGGAGSWNGLPKPNNVHGGGGGGSSWNGLLKPATSGTNATLNAYRTKSGPLQWQLNSYGYLVIGCPIVAM